MPYDIIISLVTDAFPLAIYLKKLGDGKRHITEIAECEYDNNKKDYTTRTLWEYEVISETETDNEVQIKGKFVRVNPISESLYKRLRENGVPKEMLNRFAGVN